MGVNPCFPKAGPLWKQTSISTALFCISFGVTSKGALLPGSPHRVPLERDAPFLEQSFIHLATSPAYQPSSRFPIGAPMERDPRHQSLPLHRKGAPIHIPLTQLPQRKMLYFYSPLYIHIQLTICILSSNLHKI